VRSIAKAQGDGSKHSRVFSRPARAGVALSLHENGLVGLKFELLWQLNSIGTLELCCLTNRMNDNLH
jgi:hypothetical protein